MGVAGSALATSISTIVAAGCFVLCLFWRDWSKLAPEGQKQHKDVDHVQAYLVNSIMVWRCVFLCVYPTANHMLS